MCLLEKTLKAVDPFYVVLMPGVVKGKCVTCHGLKEWWSLSLSNPLIVAPAAGHGRGAKQAV